MARKLFSKTESQNLVTSDSTPASPELISSSQENMTAHNSQETVKVEGTITMSVNQTVASPTCSQDMFDNINQAQCDITPSRVISSTPITAVVGGHKHDGKVTFGTKERDVIEGDALVCNDDCGDSKNSDTAYQKPDSEVHTHTDVERVDVGNNPDCTSDTTDQKCKTLCTNDITFHDNSDLMDELFANHLTNLTQDATDQLLQQEEQKLKPIANGTDSGCGDDVIHDDVMDHVISKDEHHSTVTPINSFHHPTIHHTLKQPSSTSNNTGSVRKSTKQFKVPRMAKEVPEDEKKKLLEQYSKKFPSLVVSDNMRPPTSGDNVEQFKVPRMAKEVPEDEKKKLLEQYSKKFPSFVVSENMRTPTGGDSIGYGGVVTNDVAGGIISCGFTSAGSGKKFTVSAAALQRAARLVEEFSTDLITEQYGPIDTDCTYTGNEKFYHGKEQEAKLVNDSVKEMPTAEVEEGLTEKSCQMENDPGENLESVKKERSHDTSKRSHELVVNYSLENIDMEQFSTFTQMPGYIGAVTSADEGNDNELSTTTVKQISDATWTPNQQSSITPLQKEAVSSYITPGGSFNPCPADSSAYDSDTTACRQPMVDGHDDEELKRLFNTQLVKQFLDFNSSNEDEGDDHVMTTSVEVTDQLSPTHNDRLQNENSSPTHNDEILPRARPCDADRHTHNELCSDKVTKNNTLSDDHASKRSRDRTSPTHNDPSVSMPRSTVFATASGKSVSVSTDAISTVKKLLDNKCNDDVNKTKPRASFPGLCTASGNAVNISDQSLQAVKLLFSDDRMTQDTVASGNQSHDVDNKSTVKTDDGDNDIAMMSLNEPYHDAVDVSTVQRSCDPTPDTTVAMESVPPRVTNVSVYN